MEFTDEFNTAGGVLLSPASLFRLSLHGLAVEVQNQIAPLEAQMCRVLGRFEVGEFPEGFTPVTGVIQPYDELEVLRHVSPRAARYTPLNDPLEIYHEQERFWLVDERWGMAEMNLLKGQWRSWMLNRRWETRPRQRPVSPRDEAGASRGPSEVFGRAAAEPFGAARAIDPASLVEMAVLWPMAQLLRARGLHLVPATAVVHNGWGVLILSPVGIAAELEHLAAAGYRLLGRRWVGLREEEGRIAMLHLPSAEAAGGANPPRDPAPPLHAFCDAVVLVSPVRRATASLNRLDLEQATPLIRRAWPITELHPHRRHSRLYADLARTCRCWQFRLSPRPTDLLGLLDQIQRAPLRQAG